MSLAMIRDNSRIEEVGVFLILILTASIYTVQNFINIEGQIFVAYTVYLFVWL